MLSKSMSDHHLELVALILLGLAACGGERSAEAETDAAPANVFQAGPPLTIEALTDAELMGIDRAQVVLNLPWSNNVLVREPAPASARATLQAVRIERGPTFDRFELTFANDAPFPGYRVAWNEQRTATCDGESVALPAEWTLTVGTEPATAREGAAAATRSVRADLPAIKGASRVCDQLLRLVWAIPAADSTLMRTIELRDPPRLIVDIQHPATTP
jgi:hypothetical protein